MSHLRNTLHKDLSYAYYIDQRRTKTTELLETDNLQYLGNQRDFFKPSYMYADFGRLRTLEQVEAEQALVDYPMFYIVEDKEFSLDNISRAGIITYIEVPIIATTDISTNVSYTITPEFGTKLEAEPIHFGDAEWKNLTGGIPLEGLVKGTNITPDQVESSANPGIIYLLFPFNGPLPTDNTYKEVFYDSATKFPTLGAYYDTGGASPQHEELGVAFTQASNVEAPYTSYAKLSIVESNNGIVGKPLAYKTYVHKGSENTAYFIRLSMTRPLSTDITFNLDYLPTFDLDQDIVSSVPALEDYYGLKSEDLAQWTITPAVKGIESKINVGSGLHTLPSGQTELLIPVTLSSAAPDTRHFYEFVLKNLAPRSDIRLLNNNLLVAVTNHTSSAYDISKQGLYVELQIFENGRLLADYEMGKNYQHNLEEGRAYEIKVTITCLDVVAARLRAQNNQPISSVYEPSKRHLFYHVSLRDDVNQILENSIETIGLGAYNLFLSGVEKQSFKFPVLFKANQTEISLLFTNNVTTMFNGKNSIGPDVGFTFNKV